ncbi:MAG: hypothetical protein RLZZ210_629 [Pseudomonadota bacterium]|jgi:uncharacterized protein (TIGR00251 family)
MNWYKKEQQLKQSKIIKSIFIVNIQAVPNSNVNSIIGVHGEAIKVRIQAPAIEGKANKALIIFLAKQLNIKQNSIEIISGETNKYKRVKVIFDGFDCSEEDFVARFGLLF